MALSASDRKRKQLERERLALLPLHDSTYPYLRTPFFEYLENDPNWTGVEDAFQLMGCDAPVFEDDRGPEEFAHEDSFASEEARLEAFQGSENSIGRAEVMIDHLYSAAVQLSEIVNNYKCKELQQRLAKLETAEMVTPEERKAAFEQAAHITRILEQLEKNQRITLAKHRVKGI
ncbi:hypothetical protein WAF00_25350 [Mameliella alba]|uniref:hypothetical protein n=1 Tax=Mameliella alba TaxID=561184 RepID=UPI003012F7BC